MKHIMVDCETLGTTADAVILSIGAVRFNLLTDAIDDNGFYASISIESNLNYDRRIDEDTMLWWFKQSAAAQHVFHEPKQPLREVLIDLADWMEDDNNEMWSMGADFDLPMLAHAYRKCHLEVPWRFYNSNCARTYKKLPGAKALAPLRTGTHHNALADSVYQAQYMQAIHKSLFTEKPHAMVRAK
jgi:hypothetical protein